MLFSSFFHMFISVATTHSHKNSLLLYVFLNVMKMKISKGQFQSVRVILTIIPMIIQKKIKPRKFFEFAIQAFTKITFFVSVQLFVLFCFSPLIYAWIIWYGDAFPNETSPRVINRNKTTVSMCGLWPVWTPGEWKAFLHV